MADDRWKSFATARSQPHLRALRPDELDLDRGFMRTNPEGQTLERWFHEFGCRRWFNVRRDTVNDEVI